jgi:hypothetical protein
MAPKKPDPDTTPTIPPRLAELSKLVGELERAEMELADAWDEAAEPLFPRMLVPISADTIALYELATRNVRSAEESTDELIRLHGRAAANHPELGALLRSPIVLDEIRDTGVIRADGAGRSEESARIATAEVRRYQRHVAAQLVDDEDHAAAAVLAELERLGDRLEELRVRNTERAASEKNTTAVKKIRDREALAKRFEGLGRAAYSFVVVGVSQLDRIGRLNKFTPSEVARFLRAGKADAAIPVLTEQIAKIETRLHALREAAERR